MKLAGLIAAAGRSERMGRAKALLPIDDEVFVTRLARVLASSGASPVVVTVPEPPDDAPVSRALASLDVVVTRNERPDDGLAGSLATALARVPPDAQGLVVCPVDMPFVTEDLVRALAGLALEGALAAVPVVEAAWGHPVVVARALFDEVAACAAEGGLRAVLERHEGEVARLSWHDERVLSNLNTPDEYARASARARGR